MTSKVYEFLNDSGGNNFTETSQRPPVPGEENEIQSNGGMSTQSSGSHKSHVSTKSTKSQSSNKSVKSTKSATSKKGEVTHSPAATPRKSNLDKTNGSSLKCSSLKLDHDEMDAPLGFEPEGSAASSPPFTENSTPPHLKWAENIAHLLNDSEGVELFKEYLKKEHGGYTEVLFWFACQGLKQTCNQDDVPGIIKAIFKGFIRSDKISCLNADTKRKIVDSFSRKEAIDRSIFDAAQAEVERFMRNVTYPAFLNSDFYVQYVQTYSDSPKSSHSSGSNSARPISQSGPLPSLPEDKELDTSLPKTLMGPPLLSKVPGHKFSRCHSSGGGPRRTETFTGNMYYTPKKDSSYPTHISYAPASAQDSELQSLSSDALTDDTMSVADGSIDVPHYNWKRHKKAIKSLAQQNRETYSSLHSQFIPRTERAPKDRNIAETDPKLFASMLIEKLERVKEKNEAGAKMEEKLRSLNESECTDENVTMSASFSHKNTTATSIMPIMSTSAMEEETAESILDQHCSRIWANSNHHTPSRSPGRHSPRSKSPDRLCRKLQSQTLPVAPSVLPSRRKRVSNKDFVSSLSCDSGVGEDKCEMETHRHIHHHHHHHHPSGIRTQQQIEIEAQTLTMGFWDPAPGASTSRSFSESFSAGDRGRTSKKTSARKGSDASSYLDSGISSVVLDKEAIPRMPNWNDPASEKVMQWMMDSERVQDVSATYADSSEKSSTHKRSHRERLSGSVGPALQAHKQSSKKTGAFTTSRPTSVERAGIMPFQPMGASQIQPTQPFAQDPSMPLPPPPNPITQIEEARRRVANMADESRTSSVIPGPVKSKSFAGVPSREKSKTVLTMLSTSQMRTMPSARTIPSDLDMSAGSQTFDRSKVAKKPSTGGASNNSSMNTTGSSSAANDSNHTIVGIYFGQEPIPYRHIIPGRTVTLGMFKTLITKKGSLKYFFKRDSDEFGEGAVFEEITDDNAVLPMWQDKIVAKVEKLD